MHSLHHYALKDALDGPICHSDTGDVHTISNDTRQRSAAVDNAKTARPTVAVAAAAVGFGFSPYFATRAFDAGIDPIAASFLRILVLFVVLAPWAPQLRGWRRESLIVFAGGAVSMLGFAGYFLALDRAPVAAATVVYYTYPVVVLVLSAIVWKRPLHAREVAVAATILFGVVLSIGPTGMSTSVAIALLPAVAAPIGWATFLLVLSGPAAAMPTAPKVFAGAAGGVTVLFPLTLARTGLHIAPMTTDALLAITFLTLCTLAIPAALVTWGAPLAGDRATGMIGSLEFVVALAASWTLMGVPLGTAQFVGAGLVCGGVAVASRWTGQRSGTRLRSQ
jgi:drug/metabolite transporter (DMT)-like permease